MTMLKIASDLRLPPEAVTETFGILAIKGAGKTYTSKVLAEELIKAGQPLAVVDPLGVYWGLRASADGAKPGLPVVILGGDHADAPLEPTAGEVIADFVIDERAPVVLDLSLMRKAEMRRFATAFFGRLYHRNRQPLHLVVDEADLFAPQRPGKDETALLGSMEDLVRRGRARGIGVTLVSQRPAVIHKDVLTQISTLVVLRMSGPQDRAAIDLWVRAHGTEEQRAELMASLASLPTGEAWFWSPSWLGIFQRVHVRRLDTFDSSATPKAGARVAQPKAFAEVDLAALAGRIAATIEKAKAEDPKELRRRIVELERALASERKVKAEPEVREVEVAVEVVPAEVLATLRAVVATAEEWRDGVGRLVEQIEKDGLVDGGTAVPRARAAGDRPHPVERPRPAQRPDPPTRREPRRTSLPRPEGAATVSGPQQRILDALAWFASVGVEPVHKVQLALFADASPKSSAYANNLGALRTAGLIDYPAGGMVALTEAGAGVATPANDVTTTSELLDELDRRLPGPQARIVRALVDVYPKALEREDLAEQTGASATSSAYANNLGALRSLGLIDYPQKGHVVAREVLFIG